METSRVSRAMLAGIGESDTKTATAAKPSITKREVVATIIKD